MKSPRMKLSYGVVLLLFTACSNQLQWIETNEAYQTSKLGFSQAVNAGDLLFLSGQVGWDTDYKLAGNGSFDAQIRQAFANIDKILEASNSCNENLIYIRFYVVDLDSEKVRSIGEYMRTNFSTSKQPATTLIGITKLAREELQIEIEVVAQIGKTKPLSH